MDNQILNYLIIGVASLFYMFLAWYTYKNWKNTNTLTLEEYLQQYPGAKTDRGIICHVCNSRSQRSLGLDSEEDKKRIVVCNGCSTPLYHLTS